MSLFYYLSDNKNKEEEFCGEYLIEPCLNKWIKVNIEKSPELKDIIYGKLNFADLFSIFEKKIKKISLINFFCNDEEHFDLKIIAGILKNMRDTNGLYITVYTE